MPFPRKRIIGVLILAALGVILAGVIGLDLPPTATNESPLPAVAASDVSVIARLGLGGLPEGELAFLAVEPGGTVLVTDREQRNVRRFDSGGTLLNEWGPRLAAGVELVEPAGVAVFGDRRYVLDRGQPRIIRLDPEGRVQGIISLETLGTYGLNGLAVDEEGNLVLADTGRSRLLVLSPVGTLVRQVGRPGSGPGELLQPITLDVEPSGGLAVADWENGRIQLFDAAYRAVNAWPTPRRPSGVAVDALGRVYAPDGAERRVLVYTPQGRLLAELGQQGPPLLGTVQPEQVAVSDSDPPRLYVMGKDALLRVDLVNTPPPASGAAEWMIVGAVLSGALLLGLAVWVVRGARRRRAPSSG